MKNKKTKIEIKSFVYCLLSFVGLFNFYVWIRMADEMRSKKLKKAGVISSIICAVLLLIASLLTEYKSLSAFADVLALIVMFLVFVPIFIIIGFRKEFVRRQTLISGVRENNIVVERLDAQEYEQISLSDVPQLAESSRKLYGEKGEAVLRAIKLSELKKDRAKAQIKLEEERRKEMEEEEKARLKREEIEIERERTRIEAEKLKIEKAKAEAEKVKMEIEKAEAERVKMERERMEAERVKAEAERAKAEAEKAKMEVEKAKIQVKTENLNDENTVRKEEKNHRPEVHIKNDAGIRKVDINSCNEQELSVVPGIGIILSKKAISIRNEKGSFQSVDDFIESIGIRASNIGLARPYLQCIEQKDDPKELKKKQGRKIDL